MGMNFWKGNDTICGLDWKFARHICTEASISPVVAEEAWRFRRTAKDLTEKQLRDALEELTKAGYLEKREGGFISTLEGRNTLAMARWGKPISRKRADELLEIALSNASRYNSDPAFPYHITELRVFGSYLTDKDPLGDLDIAVVYEIRDSWDDYFGWQYKYSPRYLTIVEQAFYPKQELVRYVSGKKQGLSVVDQDLNEIGAEYISYLLA